MSCDVCAAAEPPDPEGGLFHSQQAAEKALKGFLTWHDDELGEQRSGLGKPRSAKTLPLLSLPRILFFCISILPFQVPV